MAKSLYLLSWRIAPCEVLAGFDTRHDTPPFKSRHHPNSRIARFQVRAAEELARLPDGSAVLEMMGDYAVIRDQAHACGSL